MDAIHSIFYSLYVFHHGKKYALISLHLIQSKCIKIQCQKNSSLGRDVLELFCIHLYTEYLSDLFKKFQIASIFDTNVECQI